MRTLAHISDVHFGREDPALVESLLASLAAARPDVIVVSGDLTQRAKKRQFRAARAFLESLPAVPRIVVPGNHDVSATNLVLRAVQPLDRYRRFITQDLAPFWGDEEVAIAGVNTVRTLTRKDGRINRTQVETACAQLAGAAPEALRIIVTHHPMDLPAADHDNALVRRAPMAMRAFAAAGVDLFLSGHLHAGLSVATAARYRLPGWSAVVLHAGTAVSTRIRGVRNAWNLVRLTPATAGVARLEIDRMEDAGGHFAQASQEVYVRGSTGWVLSL